MSTAAVERGDQTDERCGRCFGKWRMRKGDHHALEVVSRDGDVGVVDQEKFMLRMEHELGERADFAIGAETLRALDEANGVLREFALELLDDGDRRISKRGDTEEEFVRAGVLLAAVRAKGVKHAGISPFKRLENADGGGEGSELGAAGFDEESRGEKGREKVADASHGECRGGDLHS